MNPDWNTFDARTRGLSARSEADLIRDLAAARARAAKSHPAGCQCAPCCIRRRDINRRLDAMHAKAGAP